jgi:hypothetical protein
MKGQIYKLYKDGSSLAYIGQTTWGLVARLYRHSSQERKGREDTSAARIYRLAGELRIVELASIDRVEGESLAAFKKRLAMLEQYYIKSVPCVNKSGKYYDRHDPESARCQSCGTLFYSCYGAKKHWGKKERCAALNYRNTLASLMALPADVFL